MSAAPVTRRVFRLGHFEEFGWHQLLLGAVIVLSPVVFLWCGALAGGAFSPWLLIAAPFGLLLVTREDSFVPLLFWAALLLVWWIQVPPGLSWWSVPAAFAALVCHTAVGLLAGTPTVLEFARATYRRLARRVAVVSAITLAVAAVSLVVSGLSLGGSVAVTVASFAALSGWVWMHRLRAP